MSNVSFFVEVEKDCTPPAAKQLRACQLQCVVSFCDCKHAMFVFKLVRVDYYMMKEKA